MHGHTTQGSKVAAKKHCKMRKFLPPSFRRANLVSRVSLLCLHCRLEKSFLNDNGGREERSWERGCGNPTVKGFQDFHTVSSLYDYCGDQERRCITVNFGQYVPSFATIASLSNEVRQTTLRSDFTNIAQNWWHRTVTGPTLPNKKCL